MEKTIRGHPFNLIVDPLRTMTGRIFSYLVTVGAGMLCGLGLFTLYTEDKFHLWQAGVFIFPATVVSGLVQGWGVLSYLFLAGFAFWFTLVDIRFRWLLAVFAVSAGEAYRSQASWYAGLY